ncbi:MAG: general secretion pathway protein GspE [Flavobacteriales bacterium]|nr:MAG: general secretion pathway protein GspE [Flavobacteriales bacterium]
MITEEYIQLSIEQQQLITTEQAWHYRIVPKSEANGQLEFYVDGTKSANGLQDELEILFGKAIALENTDTETIQQTLSRYYRRGQQGKVSQKADLSAQKTDDFLEKLILEARELGSSDIHIEVYEEKCRVRMRIDGHLIERYTMNKYDYPALVNKVKIKANLDIAEKRLPQDGRIFFEHTSGKFDIRVSVLPTLHGEKVVMRLLNNDATDINIKELGFSKEELERYREGIKKPHGIILVSGPTGSGKTTTLYATMKILNKEKTNILTVEDPIEYTLEGINQVQVKDSIGLTFASALRSFLRQDPDIIMLGEIRDGETANMAIRAALTGHLVLSTVHTNSAWGTVSRLADMGVPPYLLASTLNTTCAQRLLRLLCNECKEEQPFDANLFPKGFQPPQPLKTHFVSKGCDHCYYTGYRGRSAVYEIIPIDYQLAENIKNSIFSISDYLKEKGIETLKDNAFDLLVQGKTSIDEVYPLLVIGD